MLAPIVLFVYNRPWHTEQTLNALMQNELANQSVLYIYADGPKENISNEELNKIKEVRQIIRSQEWCKEVIIIESEKNNGLADSIINGVTEIVNKHGQIIVLEDDIITSKGFLKYINDALKVYENEQSVYHISGYMYPMRLKSKDETVFLNVVTPWGWATWANRWSKFNKNERNLYNELLSLPNFNEEKFNAGFGREFSKQLEANICGELKTWAVKWHTVIFIKSGFCLHPICSLTKNIGMDGSGENCGSTNDFSTDMCENINVQLIPLKQKKTTLTNFKKFYESQYKNSNTNKNFIFLLKKLINKIIKK